MIQKTNAGVSIDALIAENDALKAENIRLQQRVQQLDSFAQTAAHDLRNPIATIRLMASFIRKYWERQTAEDVLKRTTGIIEESQRLEEILEAILLFSRAEDDTPLELKPVDMPRIVEQAKQRLHTLMVREGAHVHIVGDDWPVVLGHAPWIEQIWMNYISNAVKYGGDPPVIEIGAQRYPNGMGVFWVRDNGVGLTKEQQEQIFEPYTRLHHQMADGHGLGLAIVERITNKLGGQIGVESIPGVGSKFKFMLPTVQTPHNADR